MVLRFHLRCETRNGSRSLLGLKECYFFLARKLVLKGDIDVYRINLLSLIQIDETSIVGLIK